MQLISDYVKKCWTPASTKCIWNIKLVWIEGISLARRVIVNIEWFRAHNCAIPNELQPNSNVHNHECKLQSCKLQWQQKSVETKRRKTNHHNDPNWMIKWISNVFSYKFEDFQHSSNGFQMNAIDKRFIWIASCYRTRNYYITIWHFARWLFFSENALISLFESSFSK